MRRSGPVRQPGQPARRCRTHLGGAPPDRPGPPRTAPAGARRRRRGAAATSRSGLRAARCAVMGATGAPRGGVGHRGAEGGRYGSDPASTGGNAVRQLYRLAERATRAGVGGHRPTAVPGHAGVAPPHRQARPPSGGGSRGPSGRRGGSRVRERPSDPRSRRPPEGPPGGVPPRCRARPGRSDAATSRPSRAPRSRRSATGTGNTRDRPGRAGHPARGGPVTPGAGTPFHRRRVFRPSGARRRADRGGHRSPDTETGGSVRPRSKGAKNHLRR